MKKFKVEITITQVYLIHVTANDSEAADIAACDEFSLKMSDKEKVKSRIRGEHVQLCQVYELESKFKK